AVVAALALAGSVQAASFLTISEARREAESMAATFRYRHRLDESHVTRCKRQSNARVACTAVAKGEGAAATRECTLRIVARIPAGNIFATAAIKSHRCRSTSRPHLTYAEAHAAIQAAADSFAGTATAITAMSRKILSFDEGGEGAYEGTAEWERPALHPTEFAPTEHCSVRVEAVMTGGKVSTATEGFYCY
ncbi:MAG TPA: hypothetical protein VFN82_05860, partial [Solirubrobacterales bacterium]|nr:hypothetical protein [Solirubrobacterales bacterium]